jgi:hypothetical protein
MICMTMIPGPIQLGVGIFTAQKMVSYLSTAPNKSRDDFHKLDEIRYSLSIVDRKIQNYLRNHAVIEAFFKTIIYENLWFSMPAYVYSVIPKLLPLGFSLAMVIDSIVTVIVLSCYSIIILKYAAYVQLSRHQFMAYPLSQPNQAAPAQLPLVRASIPENLHEHFYLKQFVCVITMCPIREIVMDPNGVAHYEKWAIRDWIRRKRTSPVTRAPLRMDQLIQLPDIQANIDRYIEELT